MELALRLRGSAKVADARDKHDAEIRAHAIEVADKGIALGARLARESNGRIDELRKSAHRAGVRLSR